MPRFRTQPESPELVVKVETTPDGSVAVMVNTQRVVTFSAKNGKLMLSTDVRADRVPGLAVDRGCVVTERDDPPF